MPNVLLLETWSLLCLPFLTGLRALTESELRLDTHKSPFGRGLCKAALISLVTALVGIGNGFAGVGLADLEYIKASSGG